MSSDAPTDADGTPWPDMSYVARSQYRRGVLRYLATEGAAMPSRIERETGMPLASISHALRNLRDRGLAELLVAENTHKGRIYGATDDGHEIYRELKEREMT